MNDHGALLKAALIPISIPIVIYLLRRSAASKHVQNATEVELSYGVAMKAFGILLLLMGVYMVGTPIYRIFIPYHRVSEPYVNVLLGACCAIPFSFVCAETFVVKHRVDSAGLTLGSLFHRPYRFAWHEVAWIDYTPGNHWFVVRALDGRTGRISQFMGGVKAFAEISQKHLDQSVFRTHARREIERFGETRSPR